MQGLTVAKIFYGNGECEIQGDDIVFCQLRVKYPIMIDDRTSENFYINAKNNIILITRLLRNSQDGSIDEHIQLNELFNYFGELNIVSAGVINKKGEKERPVIKRVMDYAELLNTNAEDMTTASEELKTTHKHGRHIIHKMKLMQPHIENMRTEHSNYYLKNGKAYSGLYHIHIEDTSMMTGATHTKESLDLYFKDIYEGDVREELILYNYKNMMNTRYNRLHGRKVRKRG